jgi:hypothetical protein
VEVLLLATKTIKWPPCWFFFLQSKLVGQSFIGGCHVCFQHLVSRKNRKNKHTQIIQKMGTRMWLFFGGPKAHDGLQMVLDLVKVTKKKTTWWPLGYFFPSF